MTGLPTGDQPDWYLPSTDEAPVSIYHNTTNHGSGNWTDTVPIDGNVVSIGVGEYGSSLTHIIVTGHTSGQVYLNISLLISQPFGENIVPIWSRVDSQLDLTVTSDGSGDDDLRIMGYTSIPPIGLRTDGALSVAQAHSSDQWQSFYQFVTVPNGASLVVTDTAPALSRGQAYVVDNVFVLIPTTTTNATLWVYIYVGPPTGTTITVPLVRVISNTTNYTQLTYAPNLYVPYASDDHRLKMGYQNSDGVSHFIDASVIYRIVDI